MKEFVWLRRTFNAEYWTLNHSSYLLRTACFNVYSVFHSIVFSVLCLSYIHLYIYILCHKRLWISVTPPQNSQIEHFKQNQYIVCTRFHCVLNLARRHMRWNNVAAQRKKTTKFVIHAVPIIYTAEIMAQCCVCACAFHSIFSFCSFWVK